MQSSQDNLIWHIEKYRKKHGLSYLELSNQLQIPYTTLTETLRGSGCRGLTRWIFWRTRWGWIHII